MCMNQLPHGRIAATIVLTLTTFSLLLFRGAASAQQLQAVRSTSFDQRLVEARRQYFAGLQGDHAAARFASMVRVLPVGMTKFRLVPAPLVSSRRQGDLSVPP